MRKGVEDRQIPGLEADEALGLHRFRDSNEAEKRKRKKHTRIVSFHTVPRE